MKQALTTLLLTGCTLTYLPPGARIPKVSPRVNQHLIQMHAFAFRAGLENVICLEGKERGDTLYINDSYPALIEQTSDTNAVFGDCGRKSGYIGIAHTHIRGYCAPSKIDADRFMGDKKAKVEVITCNDKYMVAVKKPQ